MLHDALVADSARERAGEAIELELIDIRSLVLDPAAHGPRSGRWGAFDLVFDRSMSMSGSLAVLRVLEGLGIRCVNPADAIEICGDKLRTSVELERAGIATPRSRVAVGAEAALEAVEELGYPAVLKPTVGSWGRLVARVNDRDAAEAVIEHRMTLGSAQQQVLYVQEHVEKPGRDLRVFVVGGEAIAGIARTSEHFVTNTARGGSASGIEVSAEIAEICERAGAVTGADICAVDLLECPTRGLLVNEINHSMEFRNSVETTGVDIPGRMAAHVIGIARGGASGESARDGMGERVRA